MQVCLLIDTAFLSIYNKLKDDKIIKLDLVLWNIRVKMKAKGTIYLF